MSWLFWLGFIALVWRLGRLNRTVRMSSPTRELLDLSSLAIVIPARNEELNIKNLLTTLVPLQKSGAEIIVVDDQSTDRTAILCNDLGVRVCQTSNRPDGWSGKNWACHTGWLEIKKSAPRVRHILFTDADTIHNIEELPKAVQWFNEQQVTVMTAIPYHRNPSFWEKLMGPFYLMILLITNAQETQPTPSRFFSIGQFLLFRSDYYESSQGHLKVKGKLAEDLALANECFGHNKSFRVYPKTNLYSTRMYPTLVEFWNGWERNFRLGMSHSSYLTWVETILVMGATLGSSIHLSQGLPYLLSAAAFAFLQKDQGQFSVLGALFYPLSLGLFVLISISAKFKTALHKPILWKKREYQK